MSFKEFLSFTGHQTEKEDVGTNQVLEMERNGNQAKTFSEKPLDKEQESPVRQADSSLDKQLSVTPGSPTWHSPLEKNVVEKDWHSQLSNFGLALGILLGISHSCVKLLGKLAYTKWWVKRVVENGYPRFLFFWIPN